MITGADFGPCAECRFYGPQEEHSEDRDRGTCHRYPPQLVVSGGNMVSQFPIVRATNGCGEFSRESPRNPMSMR